MKVLALDIETRPHLAYIWKLWDENVGLEQLVETSEVICWAAKWLGEREIFFRSTYHDGEQLMIKGIYDLLDEADAVVHYNGAKFDIPHLNREFVERYYDPPSPFRQIDLYKAVKQKFRFASNKLAHVSVALGLDGKVQHDGFKLWLRCMNDEKSAWDTMRRYNKQDVLLVEELYDRLLPWIPNLPSHASFNEDVCCPACGGIELERRGFAYTQQSKFQRYQCRECGKWSRDTRRVAGVEIREVAG